MLKYLFLPCLLSLFFVFTINCTPQNSQKKGSSSQREVNSEKMVSILKREGLNVGESSAIWGVGMIRQSDNTKLTLNVERISLRPGDGYSKKTWAIPLTGAQGVSTTGTRTFLSDFGLLIGRSGPIQSGENQGKWAVALLVVDPDINQYRTIFSEENGASATRATVFSYRVHSAGKAYEFVAIAYKEFDGAIRIERFLVSPQLSFDKKFVRMRPYKVVNPAITGGNSVYSGFLYPNCNSSGDCQPIFYGAHSAQVEGYHLNADVPPTPYDVNSSPITPNRQERPNKDFISTSHPNGGPFGSVNHNVYSIAGDPDDGWVYLAADQSVFHNNSFVAYDKTNQLVFRVGRESKIGPQGFDVDNTARPLITVFKRECFFDPNFKNCDPRTTSHSRLFTDVGERLGPSSDLGNGCIAILGWARPGEPNANDFKAGVYTACVRDPNNLDRGLSVTKISEVRGATYMYNDFTGSMLADRPIQILFDFTERKISAFKKAEFYWAPKLGFGASLSGLNISYRCYSKQQAENPPPFTKLTNLPKAMESRVLPGCGGENINQVEFEVERQFKQRFTRFDLINVTATSY